MVLAISMTMIAWLMILWLITQYMMLWNLDALRGWQTAKYNTTMILNDTVV